MNVYEVRKSKSGSCYAAKTVMIRSLQTLAANSFPGLALLNTKDMIKESLDCSRKILDALKCCVCVTRLTAVTSL